MGYENCALCPRKCKINRNAGEKGVCGVTEKLKIARAALHFWEEPCISGANGSGTVFFSGCSLHCVFCQNEAIAQGLAGKEVMPERLTEIFLELQEKGAHNINLVTPGHYVPHIIRSVEDARRHGLKLPIVYNTGSYENVDTIKNLEGIVDIYLPDFKYWDAQVAKKYSHAEDYPKVAKAAIAEMVRQQPKPEFYEWQLADVKRQSDEKSSQAAENRPLADCVDAGNLLIKKGVIVRQLLLPGLLEDAKQIIKYLYETYGDSIYLSLMSQFTPLPHIEKYPELNRKVTPEEYDAYVDYAIELGVENGFIQEEDVAEESFIPSFDCEGV